MAVAIGLLGSAEKASLFLDPTRRLLLESLDDPDSAAGLARRLGLPRQRIGYHLRLLEKAGLVIEAETRRRGNCMERLMRRSAGAYCVDPAALGALAPEPQEVSDRTTTDHLVAVASQAIGDVAVLEGRPGRTPRAFSLQADVRLADDESTSSAFAEAITSAVARVVRRFHRRESDGGTWQRLILGTYPSPEEEGD